MSSGSAAIKRFYRRAAARPTDDGYVIELDGRPARTPGRAPLNLPGRRLADAVAEEWQAQPAVLDLRQMLLTSLVYNVLDGIVINKEIAVEQIITFGSSDQICYRATGPSALVEAEAAAWDPLLAWLRQRHDVTLSTTAGLMHQAQPPEQLSRLRAAIAPRNDFTLGALQAAARAAGSAVIALALIDGEIDAEAAAIAAEVGELFQAARWGADEMAAARRRALAAELATARRLVDLLEPGPAMR